jgi:predicted nucleic acid-binding protein
MNYLIDTCVLFPTVMRVILLEAVKSKHDSAFWSEKILSEWSASAKKVGELGQLQADAEISILRANWPNSIIGFSLELEDSLFLPDLNDRHVLAAAIAGKCDAIITLNKKDFPRKILSQYGLFRLDPDYVILEYLKDDAPSIIKIAQGLLSEANRKFNEQLTIRQLFKKARLPRTAKALSNLIDG